MSGAILAAAAASVAAGFFGSRIVGRVCQLSDEFGLTFSDIAKLGLKAVWVRLFVQRESHVFPQETEHSADSSATKQTQNRSCEVSSFGGEGHPGHRGEEAYVPDDHHQFVHTGGPLSAGGPEQSVPVECTGDRQDGDDGEDGNKPGLIEHDDAPFSGDQSSLDSWRNSGGETAGGAQ